MFLTSPAWKALTARNSWVDEDDGKLRFSAFRAYARVCSKNAHGDVGPGKVNSVDRRCTQVGSGTHVVGQYDRAGRSCKSRFGNHARSPRSRVSLSRWIARGIIALKSGPRLGCVLSKSGLDPLETLFDSGDVLMILSLGPFASLGVKGAFDVMMPAIGTGIAFTFDLNRRVSPWMKRIKRAATFFLRQLSHAREGLVFLWVSGVVGSSPSSKSSSRGSANGSAGRKPVE